ncbi:MAG: hypothetical protein RIF46_13015 [Cyclobacteriaceae bacterium]
MKKSILLSLFMMLWASVALFAQDDDVEELDEVPSLDELLERPEDSGIAEADNFKNAAFNLYDKVIATRKAGEENGWTEQGTKIVSYGKEVIMVIKTSVELGKNVKKLSPKTKLPKAIKGFIVAKKSLSHSRAHIQYMKSQFSEEELKEFEMMLKTEEEAAGEEGEGDGEGEGEDDGEGEDGGK